MPTADELLGPSVVRELIDCLAVAAPNCPSAALRQAMADLGDKTLSERAQCVRDALLADLPDDYASFAATVSRALDNPAFTGWMIWPVTEAVAVLAQRAGAEAFEDGLELLARLTTQLTGEFAIRRFLNSDLDRTMAVVKGWTGHPDEHVRRLASEGTRPRLPWARRVPAILRRPETTIPVLDALYQDPSEQVRRSVANHLNDISRAAPELALATTRRWLAYPDDNTAALVRHALRTLVKDGDPDALALLGFGPASHLSVDGFVLAPRAVPIGGELAFTFSVRNAGDKTTKLAVDYVIHHRKASGKLTPKVFKLAIRTLAPGETTTISRRHSFRPISTRRYYPGVHVLEIQVNGAKLHRHEFELRAGN